ncbi:MSHA biogenesis protein MshA [Duganella radicis]|uniref:MSHA biogenesis protein MshA n=1 Tax=Duganella radicis TaxID=551988 RepID=A0A6L6PM77_9BURK|nr:MSHA biogenesis protein MshA [Duganella radicis]MTV39727.1 MSHA biogenesis protein MshA [Duganella radicis]
MSQQINLFNPIFLKQKKIFTALPMAEALGVIVAGALLLNWYAGRQVADLENEAETGKIMLAKREQRLTQAKAQFAPRTKDPALAAQVQEAEVELKSLHDVSSVLQGGALGNTAGYAEYFRAFSRQNVSGLWLTGVSINGAGNDIGLQGRAMQATLIPNYIARLTGERVMRGKTFASLDIARPGATELATPAVAPSAAAPQPAPNAAAPNAAALAPAPAASPFVEFSLQSTVQEAAK